ncbi:membrane spanning protein [Staphylococcus aureus]|uniref:Membrane spanning protein n=1 Tax=Staphylococcus aureus TaxID=1280 RepID=A0A2X2JRW7_STAAU|nr:membrane spanning protein [Staphylococcus aureus]
MALIVSRAILFLILALALGIATVFPEQKLPVYILFTLFVVVAIVSNVWLTHQNVKKHIIKFDKHVAYFLGVLSGLLYIGFVIYTLTIGAMMFYQLLYLQ